MSIIVFLVAQILKEYLALNSDEHLDIVVDFGIIPVKYVDLLSIK